MPSCRCPGQQSAGLCSPAASVCLLPTRRPGAIAILPLTAGWLAVCRLRTPAWQLLQQTQPRRAPASACSSWAAKAHLVVRGLHFRMLFLQHSSSDDKLWALQVHSNRGSCRRLWQQALTSSR